MFFCREHAARNDDALRPCPARGRIHWARSETSEDWAGYIEGALGSGIPATSEVARRHNA